MEPLENVIVRVERNRLPGTVSDLYDDAKDLWCDLHDACEKWPDVTMLQQAKREALALSATLEKLKALMDKRPL